MAKLSRGQREGPSQRRGQREEPSRRSRRRREPPKVATVKSVVPPVTTVAPVALAPRRPPVRQPPPVESEPYPGSYSWDWDGKTIYTTRQEVRRVPHPDFWGHWLPIYLTPDGTWEAIPKGVKRTPRGRSQKAIRALREARRAATVSVPRPLSRDEIRDRALFISRENPQLSNEEARAAALAEQTYDAKVPVGGGTEATRIARELARLHRLEREEGTPEKAIARLRSEYRVAGQKQEKAQADFEKKHIKLADGKWMLIGDWNKLPAALQTVGLRQGFDAMAKTAETTQQVSQTALGAGEVIESTRGFEKLGEGWTKVIDSFKSFWEKLPKEEGERQETKAKTTASVAQFIKETQEKPAVKVAAVMDWVVPGFYTARNWKTLSDEEKILSMSLDVVIVGAYFMSYLVTAPFGATMRGLGKAPKSRLTKSVTASTERNIENLTKSLTAGERAEIKLLATNIREALAGRNPSKLLRTAERIKLLPQKTNGKISPKVANDWAGRVTDSGISSLRAQDRMYDHWLRSGKLKPADRVKVADLKKVNKRQLQTLVKEKTDIFRDVRWTVEAGKHMPVKLTEARKAVSKSRALITVKGKKVPLREFATKSIREIAATHRVSQASIVVAISTLPIAARQLLLAIRPEIRTIPLTEEEEKYRQAIMPEVQPKTETKVVPAVRPIVSPEVRTQVQPEVQPKVQTEVRPELQTKPQLKAQVITRLRGGRGRTRLEYRRPPILSRLQTQSPTSQPIPQGSIAWASGKRKGVRGILVPQWYFIPPPYDQLKPISLSAPPLGARMTRSVKPSETIQIVGRARAGVPRRVSVDLGFVDIEILNGGTIVFKGAGEETNVGTRIDSPTIGLEVGGGISRPMITLETEDMIAGTPTTTTRRGITRPAMSRKKPPRKTRRDDWLERLTSVRGIRY